MLPGRRGHVRASVQESRVFKEIGLADELGSGVRNLYRYGTAYGGRERELLEDDIFHMIVAVPEDEEESSDSPPSPEKSSEKTSEKILTLIRKSPSITVSAIASEMGLTTRAIEKQIAALK